MKWPPRNCGGTYRKNVTFDCKNRCAIFFIKTYKISNFWRFKYEEK